MNEAITIMVGSDICPGASDEGLFIAGDARGLLRGYHDLWMQADYRVINLECPFTTAQKRMPKSGPHLKAAPECVNFFTASRTEGICLANNHLRDYGDEGVLHTLEVCHRSGLTTVGGGLDLDQAREPLVVTIKGRTLGIVAMAESEFSIAGPGMPGANPIDLPNFTLLREMRERTDFVLVLVHGGTEALQFPRPGLVELCRFLVDQGAGAVVVQHTHCVGCQEVYRNAPIIYGQGNFIFGKWAIPVEKMNPIWFGGMLVELRIQEGGGCEVRYHPFDQSRGYVGLKPLEGKSREEFFRSFEQRSELLADPVAHRKKWLEFCRAQRRQVLSKSLGITGLAARVNHRIPFADFLQSPQGMRYRLNLLRCESHRELLGESLGLELAERGQG
jgi:hypothetical protein